MDSLDNLTNWYNKVLIGNYNSKNNTLLILFGIVSSVIFWVLMLVLYLKSI